jgi:GntR family transcriptional regulator/MocR family aminotransferase
LPRFSYADLDRLIARARTLGLGIHPIHPYYGIKPASPGLLVGFAGVSVGQIEKSTELFGQSLREVFSAAHDSMRMVTGYGESSASE